MRVLQDDKNLHEIIEMCSNEANTHFGCGSLIAERYFLLFLLFFPYKIRFLSRTRHIEVQVFGDKEGNVVHFGERDCSLQRNYQKIIEEAPCVGILPFRRDCEL